MSGKNDSPSPGSPAETQPSGRFGGEQRDGEAVRRQSGPGPEPREARPTAVGLSPQAEASERGLPQSVSRETKSGAQRNKPSSFYLYLLILFGAAFLMLLLAYFVQRRNNDTALSDLRSTTAASRQELLEEIQRLEGENLDLAERNEALSVQLGGLQEEIDGLNKQVAIEHHAYVDCYDRLEVLQQFTLLEQALRNENYEIAANRVRVLSSGVLELYSYSYELPGEPPFDSRARLAEIIPLLEQEGALTPVEAAALGTKASDG